jgi:aminoglycoside phosphotransferase (APT) family kinase protein
MGARAAPRGGIVFSSDEEFVRRRDDGDLWWPHVDGILRRLDLVPEGPPVPGSNPTWPTFVCGDVVVKLFGHLPPWREVFDAEVAALRLVSTDRAIAAPTLLGDGWLVDGAWAFVVTTRVPGLAAWPDAPPGGAWPSIAAALGRQVARIHALEPSGVATDEWWPDLDVQAAAERSSLPAHLAAQAEGLVARLGPYDRVFCHGDLVAQHVFVEDGRVTGIIDWADAIVTDRHYELAQVFRDTFDCDRELFRVFLEASAWPIEPDFATRTLGHALRRQAMMLAQHVSGDVFEPIAERFPLDDILTLDELAAELFEV